MVDRGATSPFKDWLEGKEAQRRKPVPPTTTVDPALMAKFNFITYGKERLREILAIEEKFGGVTREMRGHVGEFYALTRKLCDILQVPTGLSSLEIEAELRRATQRVVDLETENAELKARLLTQHAGRVIALSESQL